MLVCGNINYESVQTFLADFFHPARDDVDVEVIFLNKEEPNLEFEGLLKRESTRVQYFRLIDAKYLVKLFCETVCKTVKMAAFLAINLCHSNFT